MSEEVGAKIRPAEEENRFPSHVARFFNDQLKQNEKITEIFYR
jgi:hypothetical protein